MMNRTLKLVVLLGLLGSVFLPSRLHAEDSMSSLLEQFKSTDPDDRSVAFSSAVARPAAEKKEAYEKAMIELLNREVAYSNATPVAELQDDDEWNAYYKNLIITVAKLRNSDSIPTLMLVIDKGDEVTQALAGFGPSVLDFVIPKVNDPNVAIRLAAVTVLFEMLNPENETKVTNKADRARMTTALKSIEHDSDPNIQTTTLEALKKLKTLEKRPESSYYHG
jgi:hypothetical protein